MNDFVSENERLSEAFGGAYAAQDRAARLFLYRGDMAAEWAAYGPDARAWIEAFVAGLNAYVALVAAGDAPLPVEFTLTDTTPATWTAEELVSIRSHGLSRNAEFEVLRARVIAAGGLDADRVRRRLEPEHAIRVPDGLDPADIPADVLADYLLATQPVAFEPGTAAANLEEATEGSNNWVIAAARTATGRPILSNDPHRVLTAPSIRYAAHLEAPGLSVIGAGEPHLPGVTVGHNGQIAFGITIFMADQEDVYVYELNPENPRQYRYGEGWEDMRLVMETIPVRGGAPRETELAFTRHGPVLKIDVAAGRAFALRSVWLEPGTASYLGAIRYQTARDWESFTAALAHWGAASMNFVYADTAGDIGWKVAGTYPRRHWDGLTPVPGDGRYEWDGFLTPDELPGLHNPGRGWIATANEMNLPPDFAAETHNIGWEWSDPSRARRIEEARGANDRSTVEDSARLQADVHSRRALEGAALLAGLSSDDPRVSAALALLGAWDGDETASSAAAAIAEVWLNKHLGPWTVAWITNPEAATRIGLCSPYGVTSYLSEPGALGGDRAARRAVLLGSLGAALAEIAAALGPDMAAWRWGDLHQAHFVPAAAALADPALAARMSHGPTPVGGSATTPCASTWRMEDFAPITGASFRMVVDVGEWDNSVMINGPGQSGDPDSPHYGDHFAAWAEGAFLPMLYSRAAVEAAAETVIQLEPGA